MSIGEFARATRLSPKALRLYDGIDLVSPAHVDPDSGYRWYSTYQLDRARWVARLRGLGIPLAEIPGLLELDRDAFVVQLRAHGADLCRAAAAKADLIEHLVARLQETRITTMMDVHSREVPARRLLTCSASLRADQIEAFAGPLFAQFGGGPVERPDGIIGAPFLRYHGEVGADSDGPVEFCCPVTDSVDTAQHPQMRERREPAATHAFVEVAKADSYSALAFEVLGDWLRDGGHEPSGLPEQIFVADPRTIADQDTVYQLAVPML